MGTRSDYEEPRAALNSAIRAFRAYAKGEVPDDPIAMGELAQRLSAARDVYDELEKEVRSHRKNTKTRTYYDR